MDLFHQPSCPAILQKSARHIPFTAMNPLHDSERELGFRIGYSNYLKEIAYKDSVQCALSKVSRHIVNKILVGTSPSPLKTFCMSCWVFG